MSCENSKTISSDEFPAGLRVLLVDDDLVSLFITKMNLEKCQYKVTTSASAKSALSLLRENKSGFDVLLCDVHMPEMDGFELLQVVGNEHGIPVVMISCDHEVDAVTKGIRHGACDYLIKPVGEAQLRNLWQHVVRRKEQIGQLQKFNNDASKLATNDAADRAANVEKKRSIDHENIEKEISNERSPKKKRVKWTPELNQKFDDIVNQLGIANAKPQKILEYMNEPYLTRENIASHLQKFRTKRSREGHIGSSSQLNNIGAQDANFQPSQNIFPNHATNLPSDRIFYQNDQVNQFVMNRVGDYQLHSSEARNNTNLMNQVQESPVMVNYGVNIMAPYGAWPMFLQNLNKVGVMSKYNDPRAMNNNYINPLPLSYFDGLVKPILDNIQGFGSSVNTMYEQGVDQIGLVGQGSGFQSDFVQDLTNFDGFNAEESQRGGNCYHSI